MVLSRAGMCVLVASMLAVGLCLGVLIGRYTSPGAGGAGGGGGEAGALGGGGGHSFTDAQVTQMILDGMDPERIRENLRAYTSEPRLAGSPADRALAQDLLATWTAQGLDKTAITTYSVLLSYPTPPANSTEARDFTPNRVLLKQRDGTVVHETAAFEKILSPDQEHPDAVPPFNAYSAAGNLQGELVYVNYARVGDFERLGELGVNVQNKICLARYGKIFRGDKARAGAAAGCHGMILYTDPSDYAVHGRHGHVFPRTEYLPGTGVQRGSLVVNIGDPETPGHPSIESAYRIPEEEVDLPRIPVHPIGYDDAEVLLRSLTGDEVPEGWAGALNVTYRLGNAYSDTMVELHVYNRKERKDVDNVFGLIKGYEEPDRYVLLGNHRDAWVFGALDPLSGTAAMMEVSRVLGDMLRQGWRPRRSIVLCSWGAEEYGIIGSREWVEQYGNILQARAVAYLNVDIAIQGMHTFRGRALPMLKPLLYDVAKKIPNPNASEIAAGRATVYDSWAVGLPEYDSAGKPTGKPYVYKLGSGSDFAPFVARVGVSCADLRYHYDPKLNLSSYPLYHTIYETFHLVNQVMDPDFVYHAAVGQLWLEAARALAEERVLPLSPEEYGRAVHEYVQGVAETHAGLLTQFPAAIDFLKDAAEEFLEASARFQETLNKARENTALPSLEVRMLNDRLMQLERTFIHPQGLPGRPLVRNLLFAPSLHNSYSGSSFPGLNDLFYGLDPDAAVPEERSRQIQEHLATLTYYVQRAAALLKPDLHFMD